MNMPPRVYCAGPLFNEAERAEMAEIAACLEQAGYSTFLPHRDGLEFARLRPTLLARGLDEREVSRLLARAVFSLDAFELIRKADAVVVNLNGRVPDEGAVVEAALAWHSGKALVLYKHDSRSLLAGEDNPMLTGLGRFCVQSSLAELPAAVGQALARNRATDVATTVSLGEQVAAFRAAHSDQAEIAAFLVALLGDSAPPTRTS